jgi:hypothetical protein
MNIESALQERLGAIFALLNREAAGGALPPPSSLSETLEAIIAKRPEAKSSTVETAIAKCFATAAVDMWARSVHSFLISASLYDASPIWASVSGYYSSHYSIRALAHLLGYFHLFHKKVIVRLDLHGGKYVCTFDKKMARDREHRSYWLVVQQHSQFNADPFFTVNNPGIDDSDVRHRNHANYADHLGRYLKFRAVDEELLKRRIQNISKIDFSTPPIPRLSKFPDVDSVQIVAYHRIVRFRRLLDEALGGGNRFWEVWRTPPWASSLMDFQLTERGKLELLRN